MTLVTSDLQNYNPAVELAANTNKQALRVVQNGREKECSQFTYTLTHSHTHTRTHTHTHTHTNINTTSKQEKVILASQNQADLYPNNGFSINVI